mmetsp:Transcript_25135/g.34731  ORF Transcript_25135/g.34731 Transcript_25135/m.34731 type:complete len:140 (-) Transcript_25135:11-430(-)
MERIDLDYTSWTKIEEISERFVDSCAWFNKFEDEIIPNFLDEETFVSLPFFPSQFIKLENYFEPTISSNSPSPSPSSSNTDSSGSLECIVCMDREKMMMFVKCRHMAVCDVCASGLEKSGEFSCPLCRTVSPKVIHIYY